MINETTPLRSRRSLIARVALASVLVAGAIVFRVPLTAWFTGKSVGGVGGAPVTVEAGPFSVKATLDPDPPNEKGNALVLNVRAADGAPVDDATVAAVFDMPAMGAMSEMKGRAKVSHEGGGKYRAEFDLPMTGTWTLKTSIRARQGSASQDFTLTVGRAGVGLGSGGPIGPEDAMSSSTGATADEAYPPPAYDALRSAIDAYDRVRASLANDKTQGVREASRGLAESLRAAAAAMTNGQAPLAGHATLAAKSAERLAGAKSVNDAREAFRDLNGDFLPLVAADGRLAQGRRIFQCAMFEGQPRWTQLAPTPDNPYMGTKMPTCGAVSTWTLPTEAQPAQSAMSGGEIDHYTCSMHPSVKQKGPGKCPICSMDLIAVTKAQQEQGVVTIDQARRQLIGVRTAPVTVGPMTLAFRLVGLVSYDESALTDVNLKVNGWITRLYVDEPGQHVARGQKLFDLYSPELYNSQQDFLLATKGAASAAAPGGASRIEGLARGARERLRLLGMSDAQIEAIAKSGAPSENVAFTAPASGYIIEKNLVEGGSVEPGTRLYRIAALNKVWVEAEVYEANLTSVRVGQHATVTLDYLPGRSYDAKVSYVYPYLDAKTRTGRVRIELVNKQLDLRPGMYANVALTADLGRRLQVPASAVVYTGPRRLVFVDLGQGRFKPQEVRVGTESDGNYEVLAGLRPGDVVATSGLFLIAAEARISTAAKYWESGQEPDAPSSQPSSTTSTGMAPMTMPAAPGAGAGGGAR